MKFPFTALFSLLIILSSCTKEEPQLPVIIPEVTYEVVTSSGNWFGEWRDANGKLTGSDVKSSYESGWVRTFTPNALPFELNCRASTSVFTVNPSGAPDVTVNLYIDGKLVASETNRFGVGITQAKFQLAE